MRLRRRASPALALLAALALAGCAKDLSLPPQSTAPVLTGLSPSSAYAGQLVALRGHGLAADPSANVVSFAQGTARGEYWDGDALVVRVPADAGSGPVIVTNGRGTSAPFAWLDYLGLGEPRRRAVSTRRPILHQPQAVHGLGGEVYLHSSLYGGLLAAGDPAFAPPPALLSAAGGGALFVVEPITRGTRLSRLDPATGGATASVDLPFLPNQLLPMALPGAIVAFTSAGPALAAWDLDTLTTVIAPAALTGLTDFSAAADLGDGRAVVLGTDDLFDVRLFLVDVAATPLAGPVPAPTLVAGTIDFSLLPLPPLVAVAFDRTGPVVPYAAVSLAGGDVAVAALGPSPSFVGTIETFSTTAIQALAGASSLPVVLATRPGDDLSVGLDLAARQLLWSVPGSAPGPASAAGDLAFVADGGANQVSVVNLATGSRVARVSFDVSPGAAGVAFGATTALLAADPLQPAAGDELLFPVGGGVPSPPYFPALVRFPLGTGRPSVASRTPDIGVVAASPEPASVWAGNAAGTVEAFLGRAWSSPQTVALGAQPVLAAASGSRVAMVTDDGVGLAFALLDAASLVASQAIGASNPVHGVGFDPFGRPWTAVKTADGELVQTWDTATLSTVVPGRNVSAALLLEDGIWLLGGVTPTSTVLLDAYDLSRVRSDLVLADAIPAVHAVSPNGRLLVFRDLVSAAGESVLRFYRADPYSGFPQLDQIVVEGAVEGLAFDATGERLWVITRSPDAVVLVD